MTAPGRLTRTGLVGALSVVFAVLVALRLGLDDPWWAAISAWIVSSPDRRQLLSKAAQRTGGTLLGAVGGLGASAASAGQPVLQAVLLFGIGAYGTRARFGPSRFAYAWFYAAITATLVLVQSLGPAGDLDAFARARCLEIVCGVVVATLCDAVLGGPPEAAAPAPAGAAPAADLDRLGLVGGLVLALVPLLWAQFELPSVVQGAITALVVLDRDIGAARVRGRQRMLGCVLGGGLGALLLALGPDALSLWLAAFGGGLLVFARLHHGGGPDAYVGTQGGVALIMAMASGNGPPDTLQPALDRLAGVVLGTALVVGVSLLLAAGARARAAGAQPVA
ncbi:hypothetical protein E2C06_18745 [Dankookia rubra]|uniref:Integral membrane bound transporter domain-containing protein n=1 Tax=Dankookia rubra TaxID=1442381 RepID=A0A4R5QEC6_9PROT|nr:FUSC family protein [Dankookia rubra]TDH61018.1 hypothetical protein E2C06_18745 [Dankookia rubra]